MYCKLLKEAEDTRTFITAEGVYYGSECEWLGCVCVCGVEWKLDNRRNVHES
jgi:hypothetical protein